MKLKIFYFFNCLIHYVIKFLHNYFKDALKEIFDISVFDRFCILYLYYDYYVILFMIHTA
jgi:hypothetical protein